MRTRGVETAAGAGILLVFAAVLVDFLEPLRHVLDLREQRRSDIERLLLRSGDGEAITGTRIDLDNFSSELILLLEDEAREVCRILQFGDDRPLDGDIKALEHAVDQ